MQRILPLLSFITALLLLQNPVLAAINPQMVSTMRVQVDQDVSLSLSGSVQSLEVSLMIPQQDEFQKVTSIEVSEPYEFVTDEYGNKMVKVIFKNPGSSAHFSVRSIVEISRRTSASLPQIEAFTKPSTLIQSDDEQIVELAEKITSGERTDFEKIAAVTGWVNENLDYDLAYGEANLSAKKTLQLKAGVCDEFSALTMAMLRAIGYRSAYIVGYAYGRGYRVAEDFVPHGWVEVCSPAGKCFPADPTWAEAGWLDAAHIKFATLPESYYIEASATAKGRGDIEVKLESVETKIEILYSAEKPLIDTKLSLLDNKLWNGYAVLKTDLTAPNCALIKIRYGSCLRETGPFLEPEKNESLVYFCGKRTIFTPFKIPTDLKSNVIYTCALTAAPFAGEQKSVDVTLTSEEKSEEVPVLTLDRTTVKPGEIVSASAPGAEIFTSLGDYGTDELSLAAPPSDFKIYAYKNGQLTSQSINVAKIRPFDIKIHVPENLTEGKPTNISVEIKNIDTTSRTVNVRFSNQTRSGKIGAGKSEIFIFTFVPMRTDRIVQVFVESESFSTSSSTTINVIPPQKNILEIILEALQNFLKSIFGG